MCDNNTKNCKYILAKSDKNNNYTEGIMHLYKPSLLYFFKMTRMAFYIIIHINTYESVYKNVKKPTTTTI